MLSWKSWLFLLVLLSFGTRTRSECVRRVIRRSNWRYSDLQYTCSNMSRERFQNFMNDIFRNTVNILKQLELVQINLPTIDQHLFPNNGFKNVYNLTIKKCGVTTIEDHSFDSFIYLKHLYILDNSIIYVSGQFVKFLVYLNLLDLSNNNIQQFSIDCNHQKQFTNLIVNTNSLTTLRENSFTNCEFLKEVEIRNSSIKEIQKHSFTGLNSLSSLDLTYNPIVRIEPEAFLGLTRVSKINLRDIFKSIRDIKSGMFIGFENVQGMNFSNSNIQSLEGRSFQGLKSLEYLYLDNNNISILRAWTFADLPRLKYLSLYNNPIIQVEPHAFVNMPDYRIIDFHKISRHVKHIQEGFFDGIHNATVLNLTDLNIYTIEPEAFEDVNFLENLFLNHNNLEALGAYQFSKLRRLQSLTLTHNPIEVINPTAFFNLTNLQHLNVSSANLTFLENGTFDSLLSLNILDVSFCRLKRLEVEIFCKSELYLNNNQIEYISIRAFRSLTSLNRLYLQFNKISYLESEVFSTLEQLRYLDLSQNKLSTLNEQILMPLKSLRQIELSGNQWSCQHLISIRKYFQAHSIAYHSKTHDFSVKNIGGIECTDDQITEIPESSNNVETNLNDSNKNILTTISNRNEPNKIVTILLNSENDSSKIMTDFRNSSMNTPVDILDTMVSMNSKLEEVYTIIYLILIFIIGYLCLKFVCFICKIYKNYCLRKRLLQVGQNALTEMVLLNRR